MKDGIDSRATKRGLSRHELVCRWLGEKLDADEAKYRRRRRRKAA
jgi:hypothetical protein